ncbi:Oxysterol-binding protein-like protein OBPalpha [Penicillium brasilianum]|uniref:Oxysterol-binding protein-like protein OBPalpha n=1 Tax=Penicillium brasilianum TaxID=104259 RepID=A0A1S9RD56_PENBI|nr:Oxysterol-binding protein-like protein OBPalpha [Penicillium brasilianum]
MSDTHAILGRSSREDSPGSGEEEIVEPEQGNVLSHIISQLRPGADLSRVVLPTFILEPRSMLERITNFMAHPETLLPMPTVDDPVERFVSVIKFYLSGWHIKPPGVKKPLNPILGETFTCYWDYPDGTRGYYVSEQTSHHPPKSSYFFMAPEHHIRIDGTLKPRSKFLGNSAASMMEGIAILRLLNRGQDKEKGERYILTQPNMYARGILFGKMKYELGDHSYVRCPENNLVADIEFKTKGYFSGTYNAIGGTIKNEKTGEVLYELSGMWNGEMHIKNVLTHQKEVLFDATHAKHAKPSARPINEQAERESQRLWEPTVKAILAQNHVAATDEKTKIEDRQREEAAKRADEGVEWRPRLFRAVHGGPGGPDEGEEDLDWIINAEVDSHDPEAAVKQILAIAPIVAGQKDSTQFQIPPHASKPPNAEPPALPEQDQTANTASAASSTGNNTAAPSVVERKDTETQEVDQFVDAEEKQ